MRFVVDSRRAEFNGIAVWLSEPVARRNTIPHLACIDADTLLNPLFHPPKVPPGARIRTICLDPGHGGRDPGNQSGSWQEKKLAFQLAMEVREMLMAAGLKVVMTRTNDTFIEKLDRPEIAARKGADLFVSLHFNSAPDLPAVRGAEVYCLTPPGASSTNSGGEGSSEGPSVGNRQNDINLILAYEIQKALVRGLGLEDRGVRRARFAVLRPTRMPAVLVESAFMTNASDLRRMTDARGRRELALAITDGVLSAKRLLER